MRDKDGKTIKPGDILKYQETPDDDEDYGKSLDEVVLHNGELCGVKRVGLPRWTDLGNTCDPVPLRYYSTDGEQINCAEILGTTAENPDRLTVSYAWYAFRGPGNKRPVRGPSKSEIKWLVKTLVTRNPNFFGGKLPAEDVAMTCIVVFLGSRGMRIKLK